MKFSEEIACAYCHEGIPSDEDERNIALRKVRSPDTNGVVCLDTAHRHCAIISHRDSYERGEESDGWDFEIPTAREDDFNAWHGMIDALQERDRQRYRESLYKEGQA